MSVEARWGLATVWFQYRLDDASTAAGTGAGTPREKSWSIAASISGGPQDTVEPARAESPPLPPARGRRRRCNLVHHLRRGYYSRCFRDVRRDEYLAAVAIRVDATRTSMRRRPARPFIRPWSNATRTRRDDQSSGCGCLRWTRGEVDDGEPPRPSLLTALRRGRPQRSGETERSHRAKLILMVSRTGIEPAPAGGVGHLGSLRCSRQVATVRRLRIGRR